MNTDDRYLKAIYVEQLRTDGPVSTGNVADRLDVAPATANERIRTLASQELATHEKYKGVELTDAGIRRARDAVETYCIIEYFLCNVLDVPEYREEADQLSPVIDETVAERLEMIIDRNPACPDCFDPEEDKCSHLECIAEPVE